MVPFTLTIGICTWNRAEKLGVLLQSILNSTGWEDLVTEVLIVNNASTDNTVEVVEAFSNRLPTRLVLENRQGVRFSRETIFRECRTDYMLALDDDCVLLPNTVMTYVDAITTKPEIDVFGGPVLLHKAAKFSPQITHLIDQAAFALARKNWFSNREMTEDPFIANCVFKMSALPSDLELPNIGHVGSTRSFGEDTHIFSSLRLRKSKFYWLTDAGCAQFWTQKDYTLKIALQHAVAKGVASNRFNGPLKSKRFPRMPSAAFLVILLGRNSMRAGKNLIRQHFAIFQFLYSIELVSRYLSGVFKK